MGPLCVSSSDKVVAIALGWHAVCGEIISTLTDTMKIRSILLSLALLSGSASANAILVDNEDFTTDTRTGLDWLDMSFTDGYSYNEVLGLITGGWSAIRLRHFVRLYSPTEQQRQRYG